MITKTPDYVLPFRDKNNKIGWCTNTCEEQSSKMVSYISQCEHVHHCGNNNCYFRFRDVLKFRPFSDEAEGAAANEALVEQFGEWYYPTIRVSGGTNCMYIVCDDFILPEETK